MPPFRHLTGLLGSHVVALAAALALAACGGGGGTASTDTSAASDADTTSNALRATSGNGAGKSKPTSPTLAATTTSTTPELLWSSPTTWGGVLPGAGATVVIPAGRTIVLDTDTAALGALDIQGTLVFADRSVALTAASIHVSGSLNIGSPTQPFTGKAVVDDKVAAECEFAAMVVET